MSSYLPLVSVIVPAYNAETFIGNTLNSVLVQTYTNLEILVVDDGSQDRTAEIVQYIAQKDHRVILFQQSNAGVAAARNLAIQKSSGEYIAPIDADDIWFPQKVEKQVQCMLKADESVGLVYAWSVFIDEQGLIIGTYNAHDFLTLHSLEGKVYPALVYRNLVGNASVPLIRRTCFKQVGGYNVKLKENNAQGCEDWELYLRIAEYYQFRVVPEFLIGYRQVVGSMSRNYKSMIKSHNLVIAEAQQRNPKIPNDIFRWSNSLFYCYALNICYGQRDYWTTIYYIYKALKRDFKLISNPRVCKLLILCLLQLAVKPVTCLIKQNAPSWLHLQQQFRPNQQVITISDINREFHKSPPLHWRLYHRIMSRRWSKIAQINQSISL